MTSQPTRLIRFQKRIAKPTQQLTDGRDACMRDGPISFRSQRAAKDFAQLSQNKLLLMPVLTMGDDKLETVRQQTKLVATDVTVVVFKDTGHWVLEERPKDTTEALQKFF